MTNHRGQEKNEDEGNDTGSSKLSRAGTWDDDSEKSAEDERAKQADDLGCELTVQVSERCNLVVHGLTYRVNEREVKELFGKYGKIEGIFIPKSRTNKSRGLAFVKFCEKGAADRAFRALNGITFDGREIKVEYAKDDCSGRGRYEMVIPGHQVGHVIGTNGAVIKRIQEETGAKLSILQENKDIAKTKPLLIQGNDGPMDKAKAKIMEILEPKWNWNKVSEPWRWGGDGYSPATGLRIIRASCSVWGYLFTLEDRSAIYRSLEPYVTEIVTMDRLHVNQVPTYILNIGVVVREGPLQLAKAVQHANHYFSEKGFRFNSARYSRDVLRHLANIRVTPKVDPNGVYQVTVKFNLGQGTQEEAEYGVNRTRK